ncbi:YbaY family lipoprotein [Shewanella litorisediminis]|uniref:YbaY family lipoprotein n=1 Tax=Shewanella litorisediminis TaxID=1173586 RepID=A0ABX7G786_9GAMM|nr:YbaY family lipoprotein [Shewanella litorisediminis]MCL2916737.1 YbaY family lipoprotein [Shewanella litorisediminis]QRH03093.1 YbaY family lipoprotein [Shewanella litorisediminis]
MLSKFAKAARALAALCVLGALSACVTVEEPKPIIINGAAGYLESVVLPPNSAITIAVIDLDTPGVIIAQKTFNVVRAPVPFKFILPSESIDPRVNYGVVALIKHNNQVIFQTYDRFPVINNNKFTTEVVMKPVGR